LSTTMSGIQNLTYSSLVEIRKRMSGQARVRRPLL
jgi:hypothetical protein